MTATTAQRRPVAIEAFLHFLREMVNDPSETSPPRPQGYARLLVHDLGATIDEIVEATGWDRDEVAAIAARRRAEPAR